MNCVIATPLWQIEADLALLRLMPRIPLADPAAPFAAGANV